MELSFSAIFDILSLPGELNTVCKKKFIWIYFSWPWNLIF